MTTASITTKTRMILQDTGRPFAANVSVDGKSTVFPLPVTSISANAGVLVIFNGQVISNQATSGYTIDYKHGIIAFPSPPVPAAATLGVQGIAYDYYDDDEVLQAVQDAFYQHTTDLEPLPVIDPVPGQCSIPANEEYLVALWAARELLWMQSVDMSQQIDVDTPEGVHIAVSERFRQIVDQIERLRQEYEQLAGALGVGVYRIQVLNMRRLSLTTNRLVPIFREQEYNQPYVGFWPTAAPVGSIIDIYGYEFQNTTAVIFAGNVPAESFTVIDNRHLQAVVPAGAQTGQIIITTPGGTVPTTAQFVVGQPPPIVRYGPEMVKIPIPPGR
jgi:hypothetical protein